MTATKRPTFRKLFFQFVAELIEDKWWHLIPVWLIIAGTAGYGAAKLMPTEFWANENWGVSVTVYSGFLAFNGLLLALGWNAFSKSYEIISTGAFAQFLKRHNLLLEHLFFIDLVHYALVVSVIASGVGLVSVMFSLDIIYDRAILCGVIGLSIYALVKAMAAIKAMNDLIWDRAHYPQQEEPHIRPVERQETAS